ncbi:hypothetical protein EBR21_11865 [bacterium]|nr:hypothetical protein [bacterium]
MKICISTLFFYKNELCIEFVGHLEKGLKYFTAKHPEDSLVLVVTNNAPMNKFGSEFSTAFASLTSAVAGLSIVVNQNDWNKGFGLAHNENFNSNPCDIFIGLNNDLFFSDDHWLEKLRRPILLVF